MTKLKFLFLIVHCTLVIPSARDCFSQGWVQQNSGTNANLNSVFFIDANTGYAVGDTAFGHIIIKTTNGGINWFRQSQPYPSNSYPLGSVFFLDANTGYAAGGGSSPGVRIIYKTTNGGSNWNQLYFEASIYRITSVWFLNSNTGISTGSAYTTSAGYIFRTTNGGTAWSYQYSVGDVLYSVYFIDANTGYACGQPGVIIKTTNAGLNWVQQTSNTTTSLRSIYFINPLTGWTAGTDSRVYKTINGGTTWTMYYNQSLCGLFSVYFASENTGWVCGCEGAINGTTNNGANWILQSFATTTYLYSIKFINPTTGWAVGAGGRILKTTSGGITFVHPISNEIPNQFSLSQNYPNPFNPKTVISFQLPMFNYVTLKVYDLLGREVATLVNEQLKPGTYEVDFDGSNFASGLYYYRLTADPETSSGYTETRKMVLMK